jgi:hypothetical protein
MARTLFCWLEQLNDLKSLHTSIFQLILDCILAAAVLHTASVHSGGGTGWTAQPSWDEQPLSPRWWGIEGAAEMRKRIGDATSKDVTMSVTPVSVIL